MYEFLSSIGQVKNIKTVKTALTVLSGNYYHNTITDSNQAEFTDRFYLRFFCKVPKTVATFDAVTFTNEIEDFAIACRIVATTESFQLQIVKGSFSEGVVTPTETLTENHTKINNSEYFCLDFFVSAGSDASDSAVWTNGSEHSFDANLSDPGTQVLEKVCILSEGTPQNFEICGILLSTDTSLTKSSVENFISKVGFISPIFLGTGKKTYTDIYKTFALDVGEDRIIFDLATNAILAKYGSQSGIFDTFNTLVKVGNLNLPDTINENKVALSSSTPQFLISKTLTTPWDQIPDQAVFTFKFKVDVDDFNGKFEFYFRHNGVRIGLRVVIGPASFAGVTYPIILGSSDKTGTGIFIEAPTAVGGSYEYYLNDENLAPVTVSKNQEILLEAVITHGGSAGDSFLRINGLKLADEQVEITTGASITVPGDSTFVGPDLTPITAFPDCNLYYSHTYAMIYSPARPVSQILADLDKKINWSNGNMYRSRYANWNIDLNDPDDPLLNIGSDGGSATSTLTIETTNNLSGLEKTPAGYVPIINAHHVNEVLDYRFFNIQQSLGDYLYICIHKSNADSSEGDGKIAYDFLMTAGEESPGGGFRHAETLCRGDTNENEIRVYSLSSYDYLSTVDEYSSTRWTVSMAYIGGKTAFESDLEAGLINNETVPISTTATASYDPYGSHGMYQITKYMPGLDADSSSIRYICVYDQETMDTNFEIDWKDLINLKNYFVQDGKIIKDLVNAMLGIKPIVLFDSTIIKGQGIHKYESDTFLIRDGYSSLEMSGYQHTGPIHYTKDFVVEDDMETED